MLDPQKKVMMVHSADADINVQIELPTALGISLMGNSGYCEYGDNSSHHEELVYARFHSLRAVFQKRRDTYLCNCSVQSIQFDNQVFGADRHSFFFCDPNALRDGNIIGLFPALIFEMSYTKTNFLYSYESFRLKMCNSCVLLDEQLLWRLIIFCKNIYNRGCWSRKNHDESTPPSNCFFGVFQLDFGDISLSVVTADKDELPPPLQMLKERYVDSLTLVNFENALVTLAPFWAHRCFTTMGNLFANVLDFFVDQLKRQKLNIVVAMDAIGNPLGFANEFKEGFEGLLFEGDVAGFTFGIGYGAANSISKVASSMAQGVGALTFDDQHEKLRRWMLRSKPEQDANALTYLYGGIKGFGVGVFGGLTAIAKNTVVATRQDGVPGVIRGVTTGVVDTLTKPLQGTLDLVEGTASAIREVVGAPLVRRAHFPNRRLRVPRICSSMNGLLPIYSSEMAEAQQELLRITGTYILNDENRLLCIVPFYERSSADAKLRVRLRALIVPMQCYICRQSNEQQQEAHVTHRILFKHLSAVQIDSTTTTTALIDDQRQHPSTSSKSAPKPRPIAVHVFYTEQQQFTAIKSASSSFDYSKRLQQHSSSLVCKHQKPSLTLWCTDTASAQRLCKQIMKAKTLFERKLLRIRRRKSREESSSSSSSKKLLPIFTI